MIEADTLRAQVRNAVPFLFVGDAPALPADPLAAGAEARGWLALVRMEGEVDADAYFALCCAAHHASVASYVPTDVDSKIRGTLWRGLPPERLRARSEFVIAARRWEIDGISARAVAVDGAPVSGHDGEWLAILAGALGALASAGEDALAARAAEAIDAELAREAGALARAARSRGAELDALRLAAILTHNVGDVDQGLSYWSDHPALAAHRRRFARLAHENAAYDGRFQLAARIYRATLAPEGHRNYPLRAVRPLRADADLLLPLAPFLDDWGGMVATHPRLDADARAEVAAALIDGCRKVPGQSGYYRALVGLIARLDGPLDQLARRLPNAQRKALEAPEMRRQLAVPRASFEASMRKKLAAAMG